MRSFLLLLLLMPLPASAKEEESYCNEGTAYERKECAFKRLVQSDKKLNRELRPKTFEEWVSIRQRMCAETYAQYKNDTIYSLILMKCSVEMNKSLLQKTSGLN